MSKIGRTWISRVLLLLLAGTISFDLSGSTRVVADSPELIIDASVATDFRALALETWDQFLAAFWARKECFGDVFLRAEATLGSRAAYDPNSATVTVRVPGTAAMLQGALVHEWAHHLEFQCPEHVELRAPFLIAQGLPGETPWRTVNTPAMVPSSWEDSPSEQYAEAAIVLVLGGRSIRTGAHINAQAARVIESWAAGD